MKQFYRVCFLTFFFGLVSSLFAQLGIDTQPVAIVRISRSEVITVKEFKDVVANLEASLRAKASPEDKRRILEQLCDGRLVSQAAEKDKLTVTDSELNDALIRQNGQLIAQALAQKLGRVPTEAEVRSELNTQIAKAGEAVKKQLQRDLIAQKYIQTKKKAVLESAKPPNDAEIQKLYNENKANFLRPDAVKIKIIQVPFANASEKVKALELANQLVKQIGGDPGRFDEAAADTGKGYISGDQYLLKNEQIKAVIGIEFYDTAFSLKQSAVSKLLEAPNGYCIIKVIETHRQKTLTLDDAYSLEDPQRTTVRAYIQAMEYQKRQYEAYEKASLELIADLKKQQPGSVEIKEDVYSKITW